MVKKISFKGSKARALKSISVLVSCVALSLSLSACDTTHPPEANNYNCYAHILPIDRDFAASHFAAKCQDEQLGRYNKEYSDLAIAKIKACVQGADANACSQATDKLNALILGWKSEIGAVEVYETK